MPRAGNGGAAVLLSGLIAGVSVAQRRIIWSADAALDAHAVPARAALASDDADAGERREGR